MSNEYTVFFKMLSNKIVKKDVTKTTKMYFHGLDAHHLTLAFQNVAYFAYRYMYLKKAWYLKIYIDTDSSVNFKRLHYIKNLCLFGVNKTSVFLKNKSNFDWPIFSRY